MAGLMRRSHIGDLIYSISLVRMLRSARGVVKLKKVVSTSRVVATSTTEVQHLARWIKGAGRDSKDEMKCQARAVGNIMSARQCAPKLVAERAVELRCVIPSNYPPR